MYINKIHILSNILDVYQWISTSCEYIAINARNNRQHVQTRRKPYDDREKSELTCVNQINERVVYCIFAVVYIGMSNNIDTIRDLMEQELLRSIDKKSVVGGTGMSRTSDRL